MGEELNPEQLDETEPVGDIELWYEFGICGVE